MISLSLAVQLKEAGLLWQPVLNDFFAVPDRGMDDRLFVIDNMPATVERLFGKPVVAFQGSSEWALDYLLAAEALWMPREDQIREFLVERLRAEPKPAPQPSLCLECSPMGYCCEISFQGESHTFSAADAADAYASALLYALTHARTSEAGSAA